MIDGVLLDLSGVVYVGKKPLPGALDGIDRLREAGLPIRFLTNSTRSPKRRILERLKRMGLHCEESELLTPAGAACDWLSNNNHCPHLLIHPDLAEDFVSVPQSAKTAVVVGDVAAHQRALEKVNVVERLRQAGGIIEVLRRRLAVAARLDIHDVDRGTGGTEVSLRTPQLQIVTRVLPVQHHATVTKCPVGALGALLADETVFNSDAIVTVRFGEEDVAKPIGERSEDLEELFAAP